MGSISTTVRRGETMCWLAMPHKIQHYSMQSGTESPMIEWMKRKHSIALQEVEFVGIDWVGSKPLWPLESGGLISNF